MTGEETIQSGRKTSPRVGCAGILVADIYCGPMRELPGEGQLLAVETIPLKVGGCAANVAIGVRKQGIDVEVTGCVGDDPSAGVIEGSFRDLGIGSARVHRLPSSPTSKTVILLVEGEDRRYIHTFGANAGFAVSHLADDWLETLDVLYLGGIGLLPGLREGELAALLRRCRDRQIVTVVDVVLPRDQTNYSGVIGVLPHIDYFLPNDDEARALTGEENPEAMLASLKAAGAKSVIMTLGSGGALAFDDEHRYRCSAYSGRAVDPSGAGDAFAAGFVTGVARELPTEASLRLASALGFSATSAVGTTEGVFDRARAAEFMLHHELEITIG